MAQNITQQSDACHFQARHTDCLHAPALIISHDIVSLIALNIILFHIKCNVNDIRSDQIIAARLTFVVVPTAEQFAMSKRLKVTSPPR